MKPVRGVSPSSHPQRPPQYPQGATQNPSGAALDWAEILGTPTTLAGYGITDAYTDAEVDAFFAALTAVDIAAGIFPAGDYSFADGKVAIGLPDVMTVNGSAIPSNLAVMAADGVSTIVELHSHGAGASSILYGARARGTEAAHSAVQSGDSLLSIYAVGYDGTDYAIGGVAYFTVDGTPGNNDMPTSFSVALSPDGSHTPADVMKLRQDKLAQFLGAMTVAGTLGVTGEITGPLAYGNLTYSGLTAGHALVASGASAAAFRALTAADIGAGTFPSGTFGVPGILTVGTDPGGSQTLRAETLRVGGTGYGTYLWVSDVFAFTKGGDGMADLQIKASNGALRFINSPYTETLVAINDDQGGGDGSVSVTNQLKTGASTTARASARLPHGTAPTTPVDGDMWTTTAGLFVRINGSTVGPLT